MPMERPDVPQIPPRPTVQVGRNQAVRVTREMELPGDEAVIDRDGQRLIIEPAQRPSRSRLLAARDPIDTDSKTSLPKP